ncbi:MAG: hypothetical protein Q9160_009338 [Pyrenula sp. 1 TL-2023]
MDRVPQEIKDMILEYLPLKDIKSMRSVQRCFKDCATSLLFGEVSFKKDFKKRTALVLREQDLCSYIRHIKLKGSAAYCPQDVYEAVERLPNARELSMTFTNNGDCSDPFGRSIETQNFLGKLKSLQVIIHNHADDLAESGLLASFLNYSTNLEQLTLRWCCENIYTFVDESGNDLGSDDLQEIDVNMTWPRLRELTLEHNLIIGEDLANTLSRHAGTLEIINIGNIVLVEPHARSKEDIGVLELIDLMSKKLSLRHRSFYGRLEERYSGGIRWGLSDCLRPRAQQEFFCNRDPDDPDDDGTDCLKSCLSSVVRQYVLKTRGSPFPDRDWFNEAAEEGDEFKRQERYDSWEYDDESCLAGSDFGDASWAGRFYAPWSFTTGGN